jgi:hypothetical protein
LVGAGGGACSSRTKQPNIRETKTAEVGNRTDDVVCRLRTQGHQRQACQSEGQTRTTLLVQGVCGIALRRWYWSEATQVMTLGA